MNKTTSQLNTTSMSFLNWETQDIFSSNFMFPTSHFQSEDELKNMGEKEFCNLIETMIESSQPLSSQTQQALLKSVKSGNRLRVYYQATRLAEIAVQFANETFVDVSNLEKMDTFEVRENFEHHGVRIHDESTESLLGNEDKSSDKYLG